MDNNMTFEEKRTEAQENYNPVGPKLPIGKIVAGVGLVAMGAKYLWDKTATKREEAAVKRLMKRGYNVTKNEPAETQTEAPKEEAVAKTEKK